MRRTAAAALLSLLTLSVVVAGPAPEAAAWPSAGWSSDWDGDGYPDVVADDLKGRMWLYPGNGRGGLRPRQQVGTGYGWAKRDELRPVGDWNGDGHADFVSRDHLSQLWLHKGNGAGGFRDGEAHLGRGWHVFRDIIGLGDWTGDGIPDIAGLRRDNGALVLYPGDGEHGFRASRVIGAGWQSRDGLTSAGDWDRDGDADLIARNSANGNLLLYRGDGLGGFEGTLTIGRGWNAFTALVGVGEFSADPYNDVLVRNRAGDLLLYRGAGLAGFTTPPTTLGRGWNAMDLNQAGVVVAPAGTAAAALATLPVRSEVRSGYSVSRFRHWVDADGDCRNTRDEVLVRDNVGTPIGYHDGPRCRVEHGDWRSYLDDGWPLWTDSVAAVGFQVPLAEAWDSGARAWTAARRQAYANDLGYRPSLMVLKPATNTARAGRDAAQWQPEWPSARCAYAARWVGVKYRWRLSVDVAERSALADVLTGSCGHSRLLPPRA